MTSSDTRASALADAIAACGYFPALIADAVEDGVGGEEISAYCLHLEPTFTHDEIHRHLTVLVLTPTRLVLVHTDEAPADPHQPAAPTGSQAILSTESISLGSITAVALTKVVAEPAGWRRGDARRAGKVAEAWLTVGWGSMRRIELEPAGCEDPQCTAEHGLTGTLSADDLSLRASVAADGPAQIDRLLDFADALQRATGVAGTRAVSALAVSGPDGRRSA